MTSGSVTIWVSEHRVDGRVVARIGRRGEDLVAEFPSVGTFTSSPNGTRTQFEPVEGAATTVLEKMNTSLIGALRRHLQGKVTLHGSAVALRSKAAAFIGPSESGKSTLAAALCAEPDVELVADDTVAIELPLTTETGVEIIPTQTKAWLLPDARLLLGLDAAPAGKSPVAFCGATSPTLTLDAIVGLVFDSTVRQPTLRRLRGQEAFSLLSGSTIRFVIDDPEAQLREFDQLRRLVRQCSVFELRRPPELAQLGSSVALLRQLLQFPRAEAG